MAPARQVAATAAALKSNRSPAGGQSEVTKSKDPEAPVDWREVPPPLRLHSSGKVEILPYPKLPRNLPNFVTVTNVTFIGSKKEKEV